MAYVDTSLTCSDCGAAFTFTARDQDTFVVNGFTTPPNRCPSCRHLNRIWPASAPGRPAS